MDPVLHVGDLAERGEVGLVAGLAVDHEVAVPDLEPIGLLERVLVVAEAEGQDEVGVSGPFPGQLELDHRAVGQAEFPPEGGAVGWSERGVPASSRQDPLGLGSCQSARPLGPE